MRDSSRFPPASPLDQVSVNPLVGLSDEPAGFRLQSWIRPNFLPLCRAGGRAPVATVGRMTALVVAELVWATSHSPRNRARFMPNLDNGAMSATSDSVRAGRPAISARSPSVLSQSPRVAVSEGPLRRIGLAGLDDAPRWIWDNSARFVDRTRNCLRESEDRGTDRDLPDRVGVAAPQLFSADMHE